MKSEIIESSDNSVGLSIMDSDVATLYIVQHELLKKSGTKFAGVIVKHPLTNECWMRVTTSGDPLSAISDAADAAIKKAADIKKMFGTLERS